MYVKLTKKINSGIKMPKIAPTEELQLNIWNIAKKIGLRIIV